MNLTIPNNIAKIPSTDTNQYGFGRSVLSGMIAMCQLVYGFFYAPVLFVMVGVLGSRKACWFQKPVVQPDTLTAQSLDASDGDLINHYSGGLS